MNLVRCNPNRNVARRTHRPNIFDNVFDDLLTPFFVNGEPTNFQNVGNLKVDIYEKDESIFIEAELAGVEKNNITVDVKGKLITLGGERKNREDVTDDNSYRKERTFGKFERTFSLPFEIKGSDVKAEFKNGILELEITKPEEQVKQKITIN